MTPEHEVRALLAERYADVVDRCSAEADSVGLVRAGDKLTELLDSLPVRVPEGGGSGDSGDGRGKLLTIMDGGPTMGH